MRIAAIPLLILLYHIDFFIVKVICALVFLAAALTDFFDGYLARKYNMVSTVGALLDPIADKMLTATGLILLVSDNRVYAWMVVVLICREIAVSGIRLIALEKNYHIEVNSLGKLKTVVQVFAIFSLIINDRTFEIPFKQMGMIAMWVALILSLYSGYLYWQRFWVFVKKDS